MKTQRQQLLIDSYLSQVGDEIRPLYHEIILHLSALGYNPQKQRSYIIFKHDQHNKQMAKTGIRINKDRAPFFAIRFSACEDYPDKFHHIIQAAVSKPSYREALCLEGKCNYCQGDAPTHVYRYHTPSGVHLSHCGAIAMEIPDMQCDDLPAIKEMISQQHAYLMEHEAKR